MLETKLSHLIKRDGSVKDFDASKIVSAIARAGKATGEFDEARAAQITEERVLPSLRAQFSDASYRTSARCRRTCPF